VDEIKATRERLDWPYQPFDIPDHVLAAWRAAGARGAKVQADWAKQLSSASTEAKALINGRKLETAVTTAISEAKAAFASDTAKRATRVWSQLTLERLVPSVPELIGGSADLTGSNGTKTKHHNAVTPENFSGNYIHYGVREHGMAAAMNGIALSGSFIPYGGTFLVFTDYCRPSIRLSALMQQRVIYVMTHDSIGLGEDGPTHQPVEHLSALRAIPNLHVFRPADGVETAECWELAITTKTTPSVLALSRQAVPNLRSNDTENRSAKGGYVLKAPEGQRDVTLLATGSEVGTAVDAAAALAKDGISAAIVSMPSFELFRAQPEGYQQEVLGTAPRVAIEAGIAQCWYEWLRKGDKFVGMTGFGASAPAAKLFEHFGITAAHVADVARQCIGSKAS
jgi:transketolase